MRKNEADNPEISQIAHQAYRPYLNTLSNDLSTGSRSGHRSGSSMRAVLATLCFFATISFSLVGCSVGMVSTSSTPQDLAALNGGEDNNSSENGMLSLNPDSLSQQSVIRSGDKLQITVWGYPKFNTTTTVDEYGTITVPLVGEIIVAGLTTKELISELQQRLSEYVRGTVKLTISHIGVNEEVSVMGAVRKQGNYAALTQRSLVVLLAEAGGTTAQADLSAIKIYRRGLRASELSVNLTQYLRSGNIQFAPRVGPGDVVYVPERPNFIKDFSTYASEVVFLFGFFALLR